MLTFDFIVDAEFRATLERDYAELIANVEAGSWKSAQVIAGSIIEAVLIDYLVATTNAKRAQKDPLRLDLAEAIAIAKTEGVLTERTADLSSVVRSYRNLIHPGRAKRLSEPAPTESSASIAKNLVDLIVDEIAKVRRSTFGLTAEQIVNKIENDADSIGILRLLLQDVHSVEMTRLLLEVLPNRYLQLRDRVFDESEDLSLARLATAFRIVHRIVDDATRQRMAAKFVVILREGSGGAVKEYRDAFFRPSDLQYVEERHRPLIKQHYLTNSPSSHRKNSAQLYGDLASFLESGDVIKWVDPYVTAIVGTTLSEEEQESVRDAFVEAVVFATNEKIDMRVHSRIKTWLEFFSAEGQTEKTQRLTELTLAFGLTTDEMPAE